MSKQTGLGDALYVAGYDLSGDTAALRRISGGPAAITVTGIDKSGVERLGGKIDGTIEIETYFNDAAGQSHPVYSALPTADVVGCYLRGTTLGNAAAATVAKQANYDPTRRTDGALTARVELLANGFGVEWGKNLTAGTATETGAANGSAVDFGAAANFGFRAYLQVLSFTGTDATVTLEDSADGSTGWASMSGSAFTQITTAPTTERIATGGTENVRRYLRYAVTSSGGFSNMTFVVVAIQNTTAVTL